jgi:hypothetical protein
MLLVGVLGTPLFKAGVNPAVVHNYLMLAAFVSSMVCAFALARRLTGSDPAAWLAAIIFGLAPYRMAHIGHLELQWTMWMPLALLLLHRVIEKPSLWRGVLLGAALAAQVLSSIYYGVFLACYLAAAWVALVPFEKAKGRIAAATAFAIVPLLLVALIYGPPYLQTRKQFGERRAEEVQTFSAVPGDYLRVPPENVLRGRTDAGEAPDERSLFPGFVAIALAMVAFSPANLANRDHLPGARARRRRSVPRRQRPAVLDSSDRVQRDRQPPIAGARRRARALSIAVLASIGAARTYQALAPVRADDFAGADASCASVNTGRRRSRCVPTIGGRARRTRGWPSSRRDR